MILFFPLMCVFMLVAVGLQQVIDPVLVPSGGSSLQIWILLPWTFFYCLALAVPYPLMLFFAFLTGFLWDLLFQVVLDRSDFPFGMSVVMFALLGSFMQGIRPLFRRGNWFLPVLMVGLLVLVQMVVEYLLICFMRGSFVFSGEIWFKMVFSAAAAVALAPVLLLLISRVARESGYQLEYEQFMFRKSYGR